jgi:hypothetical protein
MAWSASKVFAHTILLSLTSTQFDLVADTVNVALYNNSITPDNTVSTSALTEYNGSGSQWLTANEVYQAGQWAQGGVALGSQTWTQSGNVDTFTGANTSSGSAATLANVYGCLVYDSTVSSIGLSFNYFGGVQSVSDGALTVVWNASGIFTFTT